MIHRADLNGPLKDVLLAVAILAVAFVDSWVPIAFLVLIFGWIRVTRIAPLPKWVDAALAVGIGCILVSKFAGLPPGAQHWVNILLMLSIVVPLGTALFYFGRGVFATNREARAMLAEVESLKRR
jgi:hypothetical protein